ncbi:hypothetical protein [Georgenia wangjunii]|uniref:hypothetical protein n=1 Tax=Georgenia wangjunii TaxID=3117730 RepID=UPI002F2685EE
MSASAITTVTTNDGSLSLDVPDSWEVHHDVRGIPLVAVEPEPGFRTNIVVTYSALGEGATLKDWQRDTDRLLPSTLEDYLLLDLEMTIVAGHEGARRLAHHASKDNKSLTMEQWVTVVGTTGITLTATCATMRYLEQAPVIGRSVASLEIHGEPTDTAPGAAADGS